MKLDLSTIQVRRADSCDAVEKVMQLRWEGYKKYFSNREQVCDRFDVQENCTLLLACADDGKPLGTIRLLNSDYGQTEVENYLPIRSLLDADYGQFIEATRLSVPHCERSNFVKFALKKAYYKYCLAARINAMLIWVRPSGAREHRLWHFFDLGEQAKFTHPALGNLEHRTMICDVERAIGNFRRDNFPWLPMLMDETVVNIHFD